MSLFARSLELHKKKNGEFVRVFHIKSNGKKLTNIPPFEPENN